jgi:hypothetical protein
MKVLLYGAYCLGVAFSLLEMLFAAQSLFTLNPQQAQNPVHWIVILAGPAALLPMLLLGIFSKKRAGQLLLAFTVASGGLASTFMAFGALLGFGVFVVVPNLLFAAFLLKWPNNEFRSPVRERDQD